MLRLKDNSPGFESTITPKAVVRIFNPNGESCAFRDGFRGIDINLGSGNSGAVGVHFDAAQDSFFEDVTITATGAYAGFTGVPGRGMSAVNITVIEGQYGFYSKVGNAPTSLGGSLVGVRFYNQTTAAIHLAVSRGMSIAGLEVVGGVPAIMLEGADFQLGNVSILDASIDITGGTGATAISNPDNRFVNLRNVYVRGAGTIVDHPGSVTDLAPFGSGWTRVAEYTYTPFTFPGIPTRIPRVPIVTAYNLVGSNGATALIRNNDPIINSAAFAGVVPTDLVSRHVYAGTPSFQDTGVALAAPGDTEVEIQALLNSNAKVYLPAGTYLLNGPITLNANNTLMGVPGLRSVLKPATTWVPAARAWVIETENNAAATTTLQDVAIDTQPDGRLGGIRWQAGRNSVVRRVRSFLGSDNHETDKHNYEFVGNGGGRWYGLIDHAGIVSGKVPHIDYRKVYINGTSEPLTIYGFNLERGGSAADANRSDIQNPFVELVGASNVRFLGTKSEARNASVLIRGGCDNIFIPMWFTNWNNVNNSVFEIQGLNNTNLAFYSVSWPYSGPVPPTPSPLVLSGYTHPSVTRDNFLGAFKVGNIDLTAWDIEPPSVALTSPTAGAAFVLGENVPLAAAASDANGIAVVEFFRGGSTFIGQDTTSPSPYTFNWLPAATGGYSLTAKATDGNLNSATSVAVPITVAANSVPNITTASLPGGSVGAAYSQALTATGGNGARLWSLASGTLPTGLALSTAGVISGTPSAAATTGFTVRVADSDGITGPSDEDTQPLTIVVAGTTVVQFESATVAANTDPYTIRVSPDDVLFQAGAIGDSITFTVPNLAAGTYTIAVTVQKGPNRGIFQLESSVALGGTYTMHGTPKDTYNSAYQGDQVLTVATNTTFANTGTRYFRFRLTGKNGASTGYFLALDQMTFAP